MIGMTGAGARDVGNETFCHWLNRLPEAVGSGAGMEAS